MNFQEWYKTMPELPNMEFNIAKIAWNACKAEVLKLIGETWNMTKENYVSEKVIKEIEKL